MFQGQLPRRARRTPVPVDWLQPTESGSTVRALSPSAQGRGRGRGAGADCERLGGARGAAGAEAVARVQTANGWAGRGGARALGCGGCGAQWRAATEAGCGHHRNSPWELPPQHRTQFPHVRFHRRLKTLELQRPHSMHERLPWELHATLGSNHALWPHADSMQLAPQETLHAAERSNAPVRGHYTS